MDALEHCRGEADQIMNNCSELRARVQVQALEEKYASTRLSTLEVQLPLARGNVSVQEDMITKLESELLRVRADILDARTKAILNRTKADHEMAIQLKRVLDCGETIEEYDHCKSQRRVLEEISVKDFVLSEELARARADEHDARLLPSNADKSEDEADRP